MQIFLDDFHQGVKYSSQIAIHQAELRREGNCTDQNYLSVSSLHTDYINIDRSSGSGKNSKRGNPIQTKCNFCGGANHSVEKFFKRIRKEKEKSRTACDLDNRQTERTPRKCFRCGSKDHVISKCPKPPKKNEKHQKQVRFNEIGNYALQR